MKKYFLCIYSLLFIFSCDLFEPEQEEPSVKITSPKNNSYVKGIVRKIMNKRMMRRFFAVPVLFILIFCLFESLFAQGKFQNGNIRLNTPSLQEIKGGLTSSQKKLGTDLLQLTDQRFLPEGTTLQSFTETMKNMNQFRTNEIGILDTETIRAGEVYVYIYLQSDVLTEILIPLVTTITDTDESNHVVVAWVKVKNIEKIAALEGVKSIQSVLPPILHIGSVTTEGDGIHKTTDVRSIHDAAGAGIKVGIISDGVDTRASAQASDDLPADGAGLTVLSNTVGGDEGTAMLEIVHDMVPSSDLYFHDCGANTVAFNTAIDELVTAGCDIICDDIGWLAEPFFEDGTVASHVASVLSANNIIYVSSAGNDGASHNQGDFYPQPTYTRQHDFSRGTSGDYNLYLHMVTGSGVTVVLEWNDQFGYSANDYDLYLVNLSTGRTVASHYDTQDGNDNPLEWLPYTATSTADYAIIVDKWSGAAKTLEVYIYPSGSTGVYTNNISPVDAIFSHPAVVGVIGVGAVDVATPTTIESFSSQGPCTITYPSPTVRAKPDVVGANGGVITGAGGFGSWDGSNWRFGGTSASAPHVSAVAAQLWSQLSSKTGNEIRDMILNTSVDLGTSGFDNVFGWGNANALEAFNTYVSIATPTFNPPAGTYSSSQDVTISTTTPSATIHYTINGTDPTESDPTYSIPVTIAENTTLKAKAYRTGWNSSLIASGYYDMGTDVSLPVELSSFVIKVEGLDIVLSWQTESELENMGYIIEKREADDNENSWKEIANFNVNPVLIGKGSTSSSSEYDYIDKGVKRGITYEYRLADVNYAGEIYYHDDKIVQVSFMPDEILIESVYPNPSNSQVSISYYLPEQVFMNVDIYSIQGKLVLSLVKTQQAKGYYQYLWNGRDSNGVELSTGVYFLKFHAYGSNKKNIHKIQKLLLIK